MESMSDFRKDAVTGRCVIMRTERMFKPGAYRVDKHQKQSQTCPFCPGKEAMTPGEIFALGRQAGAERDSGGWKIRVVPNRYAAVTPDAGPTEKSKGFYESAPAFGRHEVIVDHTAHDLEMADFDLEQLELVLRTYRERWRDASRAAGLRYAMIFKNFGQQAGASLEHTHSQLVALPFVPSRAADEIDGGARYFSEKNSCAWCDDRHSAQERGLEVFANKHFAVICPYAARFPFETHIVPVVHASDFTTLTDDAIPDLAAALKEILSRLKRLLDDPPYNFIIHSASLDMPIVSGFHWHIEIIPKLVRTAAFEWGTGFYVNPTPPEQAAEYLRGGAIQA